MKIFISAVVVLLLAALYVYFLGTPFVSHVTGISRRAVSLTAGFAVVLLGVAAMMIGRLAASRPREK